MRLSDCYNFHDFRKLAQQRLPSPIFNYIDGAADDETTLRQNTASFERCDLVPNVLRGVQNIDMSVTVMGQKLAMPIYCSPTALQRLFHHTGERAVAAAAALESAAFTAHAKCGHRSPFSVMTRQDRRSCTCAVWTGFCQVRNGRILASPIRPWLSQTRLHSIA